MVLLPIVPYQLYIPEQQWPGIALKGAVDVWRRVESWLYVVSFIGRVVKSLTDRLFVRTGQAEQANGPADIASAWAKSRSAD